MGGLWWARECSSLSCHLQQSLAFQVCVAPVATVNHLCLRSIWVWAAQRCLGGAPGLFITLHRVCCVNSGMCISQGFLSLQMARNSNYLSTKRNVRALISKGSGLCLLHLGLGLGTQQDYLGSSTPPSSLMSAFPYIVSYRGRRSPISFGYTSLLAFSY